MEMMEMMEIMAIKGAGCISDGKTLMDVMEMMDVMIPQRFAMMQQFDNESDGDINGREIIFSILKVLHVNTTNRHHASITVLDA
jgi:hypothetical protein